MDSMMMSKLKDSIQLCKDAGIEKDQLLLVEIGTLEEMIEAYEIKEKLVDILKTVNLEVNNGLDKTEADESSEELP